MRKESTNHLRRQDRKNKNRESNRDRVERKAREEKPRQETKRKPRKKRPPVDYIILISTLILVFVGIVMVYSSSWPKAMSSFGDSKFFLKKHLFSVAVGLVVMLVAALIDYNTWKKLSFPMLLVGIALSVATLFLDNTVKKGANRWIRLGPITFMPGDIVKVAAIIRLATVLASKTRDKKSFKSPGSTIHILMLIAISAGVIIIQRDLGTTIILTGTLVAMYVSAGMSWPLLFSLMGAASAGMLFVYNMTKKNPNSSNRFRLKRIVAFMDPFGNAQEFGWQAVQSLYALGSGGLLGRGLGKSKQKFFYIPEAYNDFIFSIIGEELGFIGAMIIVGLYISILIRGIRVAINARDRFGRFLATGISCLISIQALVHIGVAVSAIPTTGVTLPFISYGGTSLMIFLGAVGILLNISKSANI